MSVLSYSFNNVALVLSRVHNKCMRESVSNSYSPPPPQVLCSWTAFFVDVVSGNMGLVTLP